MYYISFIICLLQLAFFIVSPFAGIELILDSILGKVYLFDEGTRTHIAHIYSVSIVTINNCIRVIVTIYFASLFCGTASILLLFNKKRNQKTMCRIGIYSALISILFLAGLKITSYLGW